MTITHNKFSPSRSQTCNSGCHSQLKFDTVAETTL